MKSALDQLVLSECWQILKLICQNSSKLSFNVSWQLADLKIDLPK